ncbi:MAG: PilN domain-containing protein [Armatimonadetes bacterium]|nr:PilN domain-containing protein [Armatimonadota bacterium]
MKPFNLAEDKIAERAYCKQQFTRSLRIIALLVILIICALAVSYGCKVSERGKESRLKLELARVQGRCVEIKHEIAQIKARSVQRKWQRQLAEASERWLGVFGAVVSRVPSDMWLNRVESSESDSNVTIEGQVASFACLSQFIASLRSSREFSDVRITSARISGNSTTVDEGGVGKRRAVVNFALQAKLKTAEGASPIQPAPSAQAVPAVKESH